MTPLERLLDGYYNSDPVSETNPGGFGDGGHVLNFPAALTDLGLVANGIVLDAEAIGDAGAQADAAQASAAAAATAAEALGALGPTPGLLEKTGENAYARRPIGVAAANNIPDVASADTRYRRLATLLQLGDVEGLIEALAAKATPADVTAAIAALVDMAPAELDTLRELALAVQDNGDALGSLISAVAAKASQADLDALASSVGSGGGTSLADLWFYGV